MMLHPGIMALLFGSFLMVLMLCYATWEGGRVIRNWDIQSGSECQLDLEKKTYLISTLMNYTMGFQVMSLFLFIYTADALNPLFIGAMCAAGSLKVNGFGYPALILKIVTCLVAGLWLIINFTDNQAHDYPLIRTKYWLLFFITPLLITETVIQGWYLLSLKPNIITSCCAMIFSTDSNTVISDLLALPLLLSQILFFTSALITVASGLYVYLKKRGAELLSMLSLIHFIVSIIALISFVSIYIYELPTHHCPFCILHQEYWYVGYLFYFIIIVSAVSGIGAGVTGLFRGIPSLQNIIPNIQRRLSLVSIVSNALFALIAGSIVLFSNLSMKAY